MTKPTEFELSRLTKKQIRSLERLNPKQRERKIATYINEWNNKAAVAHIRMIEGPLVK